MLTKAKRKSVIAVITAATMAVLCSFPVFAADRDTTVSTPSAGNVMAAVEGTFSTAGKAAVVNRMNEIRLEACQEGVTLTANYSDSGQPQKLTTADYKPVTWDSSLEWIAQIRAAEATVNQGHTRPNGTGCFTVTYNGKSAGGENLAWNYSGMMHAIEQFYEEKADLVNNTGGVTGHYEALIKPEYISVGMGCFQQKAGGWMGIAGAYGRYAGDNAELGIGSGTYTQLIEISESYLSGINITGNTSLAVNGSTALNVTGSTIPSLQFYNTALNLNLRNVSWQSANTNVAKVDSNGNVTGVSIGNTAITATVGGFSKTINIEVTGAGAGTVTTALTIQPSLSSSEVGIAQISGTSSAMVTGSKLGGGKTESISAAEFKKLFTNNNIVIKAPNGTTLIDTAKIYTGCKVYLNDVEQATIVIKGAVVEENGKTSVRSLVIMANHILGSNKMTDGAQQSAADTNSDNTVNVLDMVQAANNILG